MNDLVVKNVNLFGDTIVAAKDKDGQVWAGVKWLCEGLGLTEDQMRNERKKISKDVVLSKGGSNLTLPTKGGKQDVLCLRNDFVPLWIAKITVTPSMKENNPELVDKLVQYQLKAKDVLAEAFFPQEDQIHRLSPEEMMRIQLGMLDEQGERLGNVINLTNFYMYLHQIPIFLSLYPSIGICKLHKSRLCSLHIFFLFFRHFAT